MANFIYKPATRKGPILLTPDAGNPPTITLEDGTVVTAVRGDRAGGVFRGEHGYQWVFPREILGQSGTLSYGGQSFNLETTNRALEGSSIGDLAPRPGEKGSIGFAGDERFPGGSGVPSGFEPGTDPTGTGFFPADLTSEFPSPTLVDYTPAETAPYDFTDPMRFAEEYGEFGRGELRKNQQLAKEFALDALDTELQGLYGFVPASAALKRQQISLDNQFNLRERGQAVDQALPTARGDIAAQQGRARAFAAGGVPEGLSDKGLELGVRSQAADRAFAGGFGAASAVSRKAQDLMSTQQRIQLSQQGDINLSRLRGEEAGLFLPPTSYSNAGEQINVMPSLSGSQLQTQARGEITAFSGVPASQALSTQVQQKQFETSLEQQTRLFNTGNTFQQSQINAGIQNQFALTKFDYRVGLAGAVAGAFQTGSNVAIELEQQERSREIFEDALKAAQRNKNVEAIFTAALGLITLGGGIGAFLEAIGSLVNGKKERKDGTTRKPGDDIDEDDLDEGDKGKKRPKSPGDDVVSPPDDGGPGGDGTAPPDEATPPGGDDVASPPDDGGGDDTSPPPEDEDAGPPSGPTEPPDIGEPGPGDQPEAPDDTFPVPPIMEGPVDSDGNFDQFTLRSAKLPPRKALTSAGISTTPGQNKVFYAYNASGQPLYSDKARAASNNINDGSDAVDKFLQIIAPFNVLDDDSKNTLEKIGGVAKDSAFYAGLTDSYLRGDKKGFINKIVQQFQPNIVKGLSDTEKGQARANAAIDAAQLYFMWDRLSPGQKSMAIASIGIDAYRGATGENLRDISIVKATSTTPGLNVGQALTLFNAGYNVYNLVENWDDYNDIQRVAGGAGTLASVVNAGKSLGLLESSSAAGAGAAGSAATTGGTVFGFSNVGGNTLGAAAGVAGGVAGIALGADQVRRAWGKGGTQGAVQGGLGGAGIAAGLAAAGVSGPAAPFVFAGIVAVSVLGGAIKTGKEENQVLRDKVRSNFRKVGLTDREHNLTLADGSKASIGIDGKGGRHEVLDKSKLADGSPNRKLYDYDIDYTNDLDYTSGMAGIALSRLINGGAAKNVDQVGGQLGNRALGKVGYGQKMTRENFDQVMANHRAIYAQGGVKSKDQAYMITDELLKEKRITVTQAIGMQQAFNMMYDRDGYSQSQRLMGGRHNGINTIKDKDPDSVIPDRFNPDIKGPTTATKRPSAPGDFKKPEVLPPEEGFVDRELKKAKRYGPIRSKDEVIERNKQRNQYKFGLGAAY